MKKKTWRCWSCRELIPPERQGVVMSYDGPEFSFYMCHCDSDCTPKYESRAPVRKRVYPKINPRTMKYEEGKP